MSMSIFMLCVEIFLCHLKVILNVLCSESANLLRNHLRCVIVCLLLSLALNPDLLFTGAVVCSCSDFSHRPLSYQDGI